MGASKVTSAQMPAKVTNDELAATEVEFMRGAINAHADQLDELVPAVADAAVTAAEFVAQKNGITNFWMGRALRDKTKLRLRKFISSSLLKSLPALPLPADAPNIPAPGDVLLVPAVGVPVASSPEISEFGETVEAGQSIEVTGEQLAGAKAALYANGQLLQAAVSATTAQVAAMQVPSNAGAWGSYVLWLQNGQGYGEPVLLNRTRATWMSTTLAAGVTGHVMGLNLVHGNVAGGASYVYLVHKGTGAVVAVPVLPDTIPERVSFVTPPIPLGDYWVCVHNGHGGPWGWSERLSCSIVATQDHIQTHEWTGTISLANTGNDMASDINAGLLSGSQTNRTTFLPAGTWTAGEGIELPSNCYLLGEKHPQTGAPTTIITPKAGAFDFSGDRGLLGSPAAKQMVRMENLLIDNQHGEPMGPVNRLLVLRRCTQVWLRNVWVIQPGGALVRLDEDTHGLYIDDCQFTGGGINSGEPIFLLPSPEAQVFVNNTAFVLTENADAAFNATGASQLALLRGCSVKNLDSSVLDGAKQGKGRYLKGSGDRGEGTECWHVEGNVGTDLGPMRDWLGTAQNPVLNPTPDDNEGEAIMVEGNKTRFSAPVASATATTVTFTIAPTLDKLTGAAPGAHYAMIVRGRGMGQMRRLTANNGTGTITLDKPWRVAPNATSLVMVGSYCRYVHVVDCQFNARPGMNGANYSASKFVEVYGGCHKWRVRRNGINGFRNGLSTFTTQHNSVGYIDACSHNDLTDNVIVACRYSVRIEVTGEGGGGLPNGSGYPAPGQVALHLRNRVINPVLYNTIIAAARTDDPTTAANFPYPLIAGLLIEGDQPALPFPNDWRTTSNPTKFPVTTVGATQLEAVVLAVAATAAAVLVDSSSGELGPLEPLPAGAAINQATGMLSYPGTDEAILVFVDGAQVAPLARTQAVVVGTTPGTAPAGNTYTKAEINSLLAKMTADFTLNFAANDVATGSPAGTLLDQLKWLATAGLTPGQITTVLVLLFEGHSRFADGRPRYYGDGSGPYTGYDNPPPTRVATALSGNAQYIFPTDVNSNPAYNFATSGDDLGLTRMNGTVERGEVVAAMVPGKTNVLTLHNYINNIHAGILNGDSPAKVTADTKAALQSLLTNIKADAAAKGIDKLRIIQLTEPSTYPTGNQFAFSVQQATDAQQCVSDMRDWILANRVALGIFVVADLCSQPLFFGRDVPKTSQYYLPDQVHYSPAGREYVAFSFLIPAIQMVAANRQGVVDYTTAPPVASGDPDAQYATSAVVTTHLNDDSADIVYTNFMTASLTGIDPIAGFYQDSARFTQQTPAPTTAIFAITKRFAGTAQEGIDYYGFNDVGGRYRTRIDGGTWSGYTTFVRPTINNGVGRYLSLRGFAAGQRLIEVEISKTDGSALSYGNHSLDEIALISRVPQ